MVITSNMAKARTANTTAMATLNQGEALIVPNVLVVVMTMTPRMP